MNRTFSCRFNAPMLFGALLIVLSLQRVGATLAGPFANTVRQEVGVNIHFTHAEPGEMDMLSNAGFGVARMDFFWGQMERSRGVYDFSDYDYLLADLEKHNIRALWILDYGNSLYDNGGIPVSDTARSAFAKWASAAVAHFKGHHILWEMWNEPNPNWTDDYIKLALATGQAIEAAAPDEIYIGPAESGTDPTYVENLFRGGTLNYWRAVSVHPYRSTRPETATPELQKLQALIAKYEPSGAKIPLLSGEWGYSVMPNGNTYSFVTSDAEQASYFDREMLTNLANGIPVSIWYDWRNDRDNPTDTESNFGLVRNPYLSGQTPVFQPKPSYFAAKTFLGILGSYCFDGSLAAPGSTTTILYRFADHKRQIYTAYTLNQSPESLSIPLPAGEYSIFDIDGNCTSSNEASTSTGLPITLNGDVQFIVRTRNHT